MQVNATLLQGLEGCLVSVSEAKGEHGCHQRK